MDIMWIIILLYKKTSANPNRYPYEPTCNLKPKKTVWRALFDILQKGYFVVTTPHHKIFYELSNESHET